MAKQKLAAKKPSAPNTNIHEEAAPQVTGNYAPEPPDDEAIFVYCKLPNGLIIPTPTGTVKLKGSSESRLVDANGEKLYGVTKVTEDQWNYIAEVYGSMDAFHTNPPVIFAAGSREEGDAQSEEANGAVKTGLEQMDPLAESVAMQAKMKEMDNK